MSLLKGNMSTLVLFAWIFFILSGALGILEVAYTIITVGFNHLSLAWQIIVNLAALFAGIYFVTHRHTLFPRYRKEVLYTLGGFFLVGLVQSFYFIAQTYINPAGIDASMSAQELQKQALTWTGFWTLLNALIYYVIYQSVNEVSGIGKGPAQSPLWFTIFGWALIITMVGGVVFYGLSG